MPIYVYVYTHTRIRWLSSLYITVTLLPYAFLVFTAHGSKKKTYRKRGTESRDEFASTLRRYWYKAWVILWDIYLFLYPYMQYAVLRFWSYSEIPLLGFFIIFFPQNMDWNVICDLRSCIVFKIGHRIFILLFFA